VMYMREGKTEAQSSAMPRTLGAVLAVSVAGIFYLGLLPDSFLSIANLATNLLP